MKPCNIRLPKDLHAATKAAAAVAGKTLEVYLAEALRAALPPAYRKGLAK